MRRLKNYLRTLLGAGAIGLLGVASAQTPAPQEFRGTWIATIFGLDFPDGATTPSAQRNKLIQLLDAAEAGGLNAIVFQVRGEGDAMYYSDIEPWSRALRSPQGSGPTRPWDPLQFVIDESRRRGMEVHAWFNPYRAATDQLSAGSYASTHAINDTNQIVEQWTDSTGSDYWWFNPGHPDTNAYTMSVVLDVVTRYDIDGIHFDDYFYPYNISEPTTAPFPDSAEFTLYNGGLTLANWRRKNIDDFIAGVRTQVHAVPGKGHVRFGVSPFGIWDSGVPSGIAGLSSYDSLYADTRKWLQQGWVDYMAPQLYWGRSADGYSTQQDFDTLLTWWSNTTQNPLNRHMIAGVSPSWITPASQGYSAADVLNQVTATQAQSRAAGNLFFRAENMAENSAAGRDNITQSLAASQYNKGATPEAATWLDNTAPSEPTVAFTDDGATFSAYWTPAGSEYPQWYIVYWQDGGVWSHDVVPDWQRRRASIPGTATNIAVQAVDRVGNRSTMTSISLGGATPNPVPSQLASTMVTTNEGANTVDFIAGSGGANVTLVSDALSLEEANNRIDPRIGTPGIQSNKVRFTWTAASGGIFRLSTSGDDPMIDLTQGVGVYVKLLSGEVNMGMLVRETGGSGPIGADGGGTGNIERTTSQRITASPHWQYVYFDIPNETYTTFSGGNGTLNGTWGVLEAFYLTQVGGAATLDLYIDEIHQGAPHTPLGEPRAPRTLTATPGIAQASLSWGGVTALDLRGYNIYRSTSPSVSLTAANRIAQTTGAGTTYVDTGLSNGTTYYYRVVAADHFGYESASLVEVSASPAADTTAPASSASITPTLTAGNSVTVAFTASDAASGVASTELFVKTPGAGSFVSTGLTQTGTSGSFSYTLAAGDGTYEFYTRATDVATNVEAAPGSADDSIVRDATAPGSSASITPTLTNSGSVTVAFTASDATSGVSSTELFVKTPGAGSFVSTGLTQTGTSGSFSYTLAAGDGTYEFYTRATDVATNVEAAPGSADDSIVRDATEPGSSASIASTLTNLGTVTVGFTSSDAGSGISSTELFVKAPAAGSFASTGLTQTGTSGNFVYTFGAGDGTYEFYTRATDAAGNVETAPVSADDSISRDATVPTSSAAAADTTRVGPGAMTGTYTASGTGSAVSGVVLYVKIPGGAWASAGSVTGGTWSYTPVGSGDFIDGAYAFATVATDAATNAETAPTGSDSGDVTVLYNNTANSNYAVTRPAAGTATFPMTDALDIQIAVAGGTAPFNLTVARTTGDTAPTAGYNTARLVDENLSITGSLNGGSATLTWNLDPASDDGLTLPFNTVFQFNGSTLVNTFPVTTGANPVTVTGITSFSSWWVGNNDAKIGDWTLY